MERQSINKLQREISMTDEQLMDSFAGGEENSFHILLTKWSQKLLRFIQKSIHREEVARELLQDTLVNIYRGKETWNSKENKFSNWVYTIARNVMIASTRSKRAKMEVLWIDEEEDRTSFSEDPITKMALTRAINSLPKHLSEAFRLTFIEGMDHNEAAAVARVSPDNMRARASRSRSALRDLVS